MFRSQQKEKKIIWTSAENQLAYSKANLHAQAGAKLYYV